MRVLAWLPAWGRSRGSRVTRRPKVAVHDTGLGANLAGFASAHASTIGGREYYSAIVEQFVAWELGKQQGWSEESYSLSHFRDLDGLEVDIVVELARGRLLAIEVKSSSTLTEKAWRNLLRFRQRFSDREVTAVCLHTGTDVAVIEGWLHLLPITSLWQH